MTNHGVLPPKSNLTIQTELNLLEYKLQQRILYATIHHKELSQISISLVQAAAAVISTRCESGTKSKAREAGTQS